MKPDELFNNKRAFQDTSKPIRLPMWLHRSLPKGGELWKTSSVIQGRKLHTVCEEAKCPNLMECYSKKTATFLIMGKSCTRSCGFCAIDFSKKPEPLNQEEPKLIAESVLQLNLKHVVITMVARDDLEDGGADHLGKVMQEIRKSCKNTTIEVLTSDFQGSKASLDRVLLEEPEVFNHNIETVRSLTPRVRHKATYENSLSLLSYVRKNSSLFVKSGIMLGLGEKKEEVRQTLSDLADVGCDIVTIGQYLRPTKGKLMVREYIHPDTFKEYEDMGKLLGINNVYAGPFVRSSYNANLVLKRASGEEVIIQSD